MKREHGFAVCLAMAGLGFPVPVFGQSAPTNLEFEVATVRQNKSGPPERPRIPGDGQGTLLPSGQFIMRNQLLKTLLGFAFNPNNQRFGDDLIVGVPAWVNSDRFDVVGKAPAGTPPRQCFFSGFCYPDKALAAMLRSFLEKEFKIASHQEQRPTSVYALVVGKNGPKLQRSAEPGDHFCRHIDGGTSDPDAKGVPSEEAGFFCTKISMAEFADFLPELAPGYLDRVVVNSTGLEGAFDLRLTWVPRANIEWVGGITAFDAVEKELGLKLEGRKLPITVTVIDHIEKLADDAN